MDYPSENHSEKQSRFLDTQEIQAIQQKVEPVEKILGMVDIWVYALMIVSCLILIGWIIFH